MSAGVSSTVIAGTVIGGAMLGSAYMSSKASANAAEQYANSANQGLQYNQQMFNLVNEQNAPYRKLGEQGVNTYQQLLDSGYLTQQPSMDDLTRLMPNYKFGMQQGLGQFNAGVNAAGGAVSGNAIQGGQQFAQDYAGNSLNNAFNQFQANRSNVASNVGAATGFGLNANQISGGAASGSASNASSLLSSIGNAQAQSTMAQSNAYTSQLNNLSNYAMLYGMKNMPSSTAGGGSDIRLKENIKQIGQLPNGLNVYKFEYKSEFKNHKACGHGEFIGVMAQEVEKLIPEAVFELDNGYKAVKYEMIN